MERRTFFGWIGKAALFIGMSSLIMETEEPKAGAPVQAVARRAAQRRMRMSGRACHDYRMISDDRSLMLDREIFNA